MRKVCSLGVHASRGPTHTSGACCRAPLTACVQAQVQRLCSKYAVTANHFRQFQNAGPINRSDMASGLRNFQRIIAVNLQRVCKVASLRTQKFRGFTIPRQFRDDICLTFGHIGFLNILTCTALSHSIRSLVLAPDSLAASGPSEVSFLDACKRTQIWRRPDDDGFGSPQYKLRPASVL